MDGLVKLAPQGPFNVTICSSHYSKLPWRRSFFNAPAWTQQNGNPTLTVLHERHLNPLVTLPHPSVLVPHIGVVRLGVLVPDPSRLGGDGDYVKNNGEEQQQGHDPPAAGVGDPTAKHDRRSECVLTRGAAVESRRTSWLVTRGADRSGYIYWLPVRLCAKKGRVTGCGADSRCKKTKTRHLSV